MLEEPLIYVLALGGIWFALRRLTFSEQITGYIENGFWFIVIVAVTWFIARLLEALIDEYLAPIVEKSESDLDDQLLPVTKKAIKYTIWILGIIVALNNAGFNAFQIALEQAATNSRYSHNKLGDLFPLLEPDEMVIQVDEQLIKLDNHLMEFLMLNLMIAIYYSHLGRKVARSGAIESGDIEEILASFPEKILPARRKKRAYISSILSKNEKSKEGRYNRKLFYRTKRGHYIINPGLSIKIQDEWRNIYDFIIKKFLL